MSVLLSSDEVRHQSKSVFGQFGESLWIPNAKINAKLKNNNLNDLQHSGIGKFAVLVAMGPSLENEIETIKKYRDRIDVICCDKAFGPLLDHGVKADIVVVADASIPFKYIEKYVKDTEGIKLLATPYANTEWTRAWKGPIYFYLNQDAIETEQVFRPIIGDVRMIPASSNVSNAMCVLWTNCEGKKNENWGGYEAYYLVGYDYSWPINGNYYAWDNPIPKRHYMNHRTIIDIAGKVVFTSENLIFSCKWLISYATTFKLPIFNASMQGILDIPNKVRLSDVLPRISIKNRDMIRDSFLSWKDSFQAFKRAEQSYFSIKEALLWQ